MDLSKSSDSFLFDPLRSSWKKETPEERVRQELLHNMVTFLGYPKEMIAVEKSISEIPHVAFSKDQVPVRRMDVVCFGKNIHPSWPLYPLMLIECKQEGKLKGALDQILGYNHYVGAYFIAVATKGLFLLQYKIQGKLVQKELTHPPLYEELIRAVS